MTTPLNTILVGIWWEDIVKDDNWGEDGDSNVTPIECYSCGHIIKETATFIRLGSSYDYRADQWATLHAIPIGAITDRKIFYEPPEETE